LRSKCAACEPPYIRERTQAARSAVSATADRISAGRAAPQRRSSLSSRHRRHCQGHQRHDQIWAASRRCRALPDRPSNRLRPAAMMPVASGKVLPSIALSTACRASSGSQRRSRVDLWHQSANYWHAVTRPGWDCSGSNNLSAVDPICGRQAYGPRESAPPGAAIARR
jgi:hypothetical protein